MEAVGKSYMRKGFLIYEEMQPLPSGFPYIHKENFVFFSISAPTCLT